MNGTQMLGEIWQAHVAGEAPPDLDDSLQALWQEGKSAWPGLALSAPVFVRHLARHLPPGHDPQRFLEAIAAPDLYLACACAGGDPVALAALERAVLVHVPTFVRRIDPSPAFADEVTQVLRERLLVARDGEEPRIAGYGGDGALLSFVRVTALRTALNLRRNQDDRPMDDIEDAVIGPLAHAGDAELGYLRARHQAEFQEALRAAFAALPLEQRNVVRMHYSGGLTCDRIAAVLQLNRSTVLRRLSAARTALLHETRRLLQERLRLSPADLDSLIQALRSQLDVSLSVLLGAEAPEG